jgi:aerobic carbon-monoxide dehydrogenase large subunit
VALKVETTANLGAYLSLFGSSVPTYLYGTLLAGQYRTPNIFVEVQGVYTNTAPVDAYRGAGRPEATYVVERIVEVAARQLGRRSGRAAAAQPDPPEDFPYQTPVALVYDTGNYEASLDKALELIDYAAFPRAAEAAHGASGAASASPATSRHAVWRLPSSPLRSAPAWASTRAARSASTRPAT